MTSRRNVSSVRQGAYRSQTAGWLAACGGETSRMRAKAQLHIGGAVGGANGLVHLHFEAERKNVRWNDLLAFFRP